MNELLGKRLVMIKKLPTIETALKSEQEVEQIILEFEGGISLSVNAMDPDPNSDSTPLKVRIC